MWGGGQLFVGAAPAQQDRVWLWGSGCGVSSADLQIVGFAESDGPANCGIAEDGCHGLLSWAILAQDGVMRVSWRFVTGRCMHADSEARLFLAC